MNPNYTTGSGFTPVHMAASFGELEVIKYLIEEADAWPDKKDNRGLMPEDYAKTGGNAMVYQYLMSI